MADVKISALPLASTPLTGTEILPIVQSSTTDQVTVANLTAGRAVSAASLTLTSPLTFGNGGTGSTSFTANYIPYSNGTSLTSSANFTYNGTSVAIGSALAPNPGGTLQVHGANRTVDNNGNLSVFSTNSATVNAGGLLSFGGFNGTGGTFDPWTFANIKGAKENGTSGNFAGYFVISTASSGGVISEKMRIDSSGNVGIATAPSYRLHVVGVTDIVQYNANATVGSTKSRIGFQDASTTFAPNIGGAGNSVTIDTVGAERMRIDALGNVVVNTAAIATTATDGFLYVPTCAGTPTGTPTTYTGRAPIVVNTTNNKLYFYSGGAWRDAGP